MCMFWLQLIPRMNIALFNISFKVSCGLNSNAHQLCHEYCKMFQKAKETDEEREAKLKQEREEREKEREKEREERKKKEEERKKEKEREREERKKERESRREKDSDRKKRSRSRSRSRRSRSRDRYIVSWKVYQILYNKLNICKIHKTFHFSCIILQVLRANSVDPDRAPSL